MALFLLKSSGVFSAVQVKKGQIQPPESNTPADYNREDSGIGIMISSEPVINIGIPEDLSVSGVKEAVLTGAGQPKPAAQKPEKNIQESPAYVNKSGFQPFYVYNEAGKKDNHFYPSGLMGNISSLSINQTLNKGVKSGKTCIKVSYNASVGGIAWAGLYWTEPANNWGGKPGFNLTGAERVSFWARGENGGEIINNFIIGGIQGQAFEDSDSRSIGPVELSKEWKQYFISLEEADLKNIIGGFCFTVTKNDNPEGAVFYLDNIVYE
jgi:hypothetical protein